MTWLQNQSVDCGKPKPAFFSFPVLPLAILFLMLLSAFRPETVAAQWPRVALSSDGTPVSYEVYGLGEPTLIFVHGWSCDSRYFREQVPMFSKKNRVVVLDLAGHGHSGLSRKEYTMKSFGQDVLAVADAVNAKSAILIGHSMGGPVIAEAARLMPGRVVGLVGVDTLVNVEYPMTRAMVDGMTLPLKKDFPSGCRNFVQTMLKPDSDSTAREWILSDMAAAPPHVAMSAMEHMMELYVTGDIARIFQTIPVPVVTVNADLWPVDLEANRRHMHSFDAVILKDTDHFLMMTRSSEFNRKLDRVITRLTQNAKGCGTDREKTP